MEDRGTKMSTYYYFTCQKCRTRGGFLGKEAWGWGSFDMIESYKFLAYHITTCGESEIRIISEEVDDYVDLLHEEYNAFLDQTSHIFPHSADWEFFDRWKHLEVEEIKQKWTEQTRIAQAEERVKVTGVLEELHVKKEGVGHYFYRGRVTCANGQTVSIAARTRALPQVDQSYIIIGVEQEHPELGEVLEVRKIIPVA